MYTVDFNDGFTPVLDRLSAHLGDMTEVFQDLGELLVQQTKDRFPTGTAPDGSKWAPKSKATLAAYGARKSNRVDPRPLFGPTGRLSSEIFYQAAPHGVTWGSNMIYAAVMQFGAAKGAFGTAANGSPIPWGDIPARPYIGLSDEDRSAVTAELERWLAGITATP